MPRELRTYAGALYSSVWLYYATSKAEAGRLLFERIGDDWRRGTSAGAMSRYVGPLCWCPRQRRLWFEMSVATNHRAVHPSLVPAELWGGIEIREASAIAGEYSRGFSPRSTGEAVTEADLLANIGIGCALVNAADRVPFDPIWAKANDSAGEKIARQIRASGDFAALVIMADALEEAGCSSPLLLAHCRAAIQHLPGCWAVEQVCGRKER